VFALVDWQGGRREEEGRRRSRGWAATRHSRHKPGREEHEINRRLTTNTENMRRNAAVMLLFPLFHGVLSLNSFPNFHQHQQSHNRHSPSIHLSSPALGNAGLVHSRTSRQLVGLRGGGAGNLSAMMATFTKVAPLLGVTNPKPKPTIPSHKAQTLEPQTKRPGSQTGNQKADSLDSTRCARICGPTNHCPLSFEAGAMNHMCSTTDFPDPKPKTR
jgi:hypothetical protein